MAKKKTSRKEIKADLLEQLERNGMIGKYYIDLVDDYMEMYDIENKLLEDIKLRGVSVEYNNGGGQQGQKRNDSVDMLLKTNKQMISILDALGIKPSMDGDPIGDMEM